MKRRKTIRVPYGRKPEPGAPPMRVEKRQLQLAMNAEALDRWIRRLTRASNEVSALLQQRKRLLKPRPPNDVTTVEEDFNDALP